MNFITVEIFFWILHKFSILIVDLDYFWIFTSKWNIEIMFV